MDEVKVSVCMVTYNHDRYIRQAVESVLEQRTSFPIELVIGEDCSTDDTRSILCELAERNPGIIRLRLAERNQGGKENFMGTFAACRGQYVAMLEGDDYWTCPNKLQLQVDALNARPDWAICFHQAECIYEDGIVGPAHHPERWDKPEATLVDLFSENFIPTNAVMFRNRLFGALPPWFAELTLGDWPLHILNAEHGNIGFLPDVMSAYRVHARSYWSSRSVSEKLIGIFEMLTAVDHHMRGNHAAAIDQYRHNTLVYLVAEIDATKELAAREAAAREAAAQEAAAKAKAARLSNEEFVRLQRELIGANVNYQRLAQEHRFLRDFHDSWSRTTTYRVAREVRRLLKQLGDFMRRHVRRPKQSPPPSADAASEAA